jgi:D-alanyl-D-alanine carboxypeptidase
LKNFQAKADYVQQHIYDVAKMNASGSIPKTERPEKLATGYMRDDNGKWIANWNTLPWRGMSAGGGDSTAGDLLRFDQALRNHKLLNAELTETVMTAKVNPNPDSQNDKYAYGFEDKLVGPHRVTGHSGGAPGMNSELNMFLDNGYTVVVLSNLDPPTGQRVASYIRGRLN